MIFSDWSSSLSVSRILAGVLSPFFLLLEDVNLFLICCRRPGNIIWQAKALMALESFSVLSIARVRSFSEMLLRGFLQVACVYCNGLQKSGLKRKICSFSSSSEKFSGSISFSFPLKSSCFILSFSVIFLQECR